MYARALHGQPFLESPRPGRLPLAKKRPPEGPLQPRLCVSIVQLGVVEVRHLAATGR